MRFQYRAADQDGQIQRGQMQASNQADLELRLSRLGLLLIHGEVGRSEWWAKQTISRRELITFCFHLEQLSRAGVPLLQALSDLRDSVELPHFREIIANVIEDIEGGQQLSQALAAHPKVFDALIIHLIQAGEESGELAAVLGRLCESLKWQDELIAQTQRFLLYPAFVGIVVFGVMCFLMVYLVPQLLEFMRAMKQTLPLSTKILLWISEAFIRYWWLLLGLPIALILIGRWRYVVDERFRRHCDAWLLQLPALGAILQKIILARFANCFALLYAAGIPILDCIRITQGVVNNRQIAHALLRVEGQIREGFGVSASFERIGLFPPLVLRMLRVGEGTGQLDYALHNVSYFYDRDIKESIARFHALIEPTMTVILGFLLAWIMSSVLGPIFDAIGQLR
ncbi:type II secretion system F family protein [Chitinibacter sp. SCUT-21]|uniref:type II secretion system F family protein n=1 Tax=Chitinibacter sp. SCUT-21 TaxID=2970891 RepID=UPI0035A67077